MKKRVVSLVLTVAVLLGLMPFTDVAKPHVEAALSSGTTAASVVANMGIGINLGNTLDAYDGGSYSNPIQSPNWKGWFGNDYAGLTPARMETAWLEAYPIPGSESQTNRALMKCIKDAGFDTIRIPVTWHKAISNPSSSSFTVRADWLKHVKQIVDWAIAENLYVILNTHHDEYWLPFSDSSETSASATKLKRLWSLIGAEFNDSYDERLIFEVLNEPRIKGHPQQWQGGIRTHRQNLNTLNQAAVDGIRGTGGNNRYRILMIPTYAASCAPSWADNQGGSFDNFKMPTDSGNSVNKFILSVHAYDPGDYTGTQGVKDTYNKKDYTDAFDRTKTAADSLKVPVVIGEWGVVARNNTDGSGTGEATRAAYAKDYVTEATKRGFVTVWWDSGILGPVNQTEGRWGLIDRRAKKVHYTSIVNAIKDGYKAGGGSKPNPDPVTKTTMGLSSSSNYTYPSAPTGYSGSDYVLERTVSNTGGTGAVTTGEITVTLSGTNASSFVMRSTSNPVSTTWTGSPIKIDTANATSGARKFEIRPSSGLAVGTYTATVTVTAPNVTLSTSSHSFNVTFTVTAASTPTFTVSPTTTTISARSGTGSTATLTAGGTATGTITLNRPSGMPSWLTTTVSGSSINVGLNSSVPDSAQTGSYTVTATRGGVNTTFTVSVNLAAVVVQVASISLEKPAAHTFPSAAVDYSTQAALVNRVNSTGTAAPGVVTVTLTGTNAKDFRLRPENGASDLWVSNNLELASMNAGSGARGFEVRPAGGLAVGTYTATVNVKAANVATALTFNVTFTVTAAVIAPTYVIALNSTSAHTFAASNLGYNNIGALTRTVSNKGNQATGALTVALSGANANNFQLTTSSSGNSNWQNNGSSVTLDSIAAGNSTREFRVRPANGLAAGTYTTTVTVSGGNGIAAQSFTVSFTVNPPPPTYEIGISPSTSYTFPSANAGYSTQNANTRTVNSSGNQATGTLTVALSGANANSFQLGSGSNWQNAGNNLSLDSIAAGANRSFTVRPVNGLTPGTYNATVTVSGGNGIVSRMFTVSFTVNRTPLTGELTLTGSNGIDGTLSVDTSKVGGSGAFSYQWTADGTNISGATSSSFKITGAQAGRKIGVIVSRADNTGSVTVTAPDAVPFNLNGIVSGSVSGDAIAIDPGFGRAGDKITLTYTLAGSGANNKLSFTGATGLDTITQAGSGTLTYTVNANDATNGVITITAQFTHTSLTLRTLTFEHNNQKIVFGEPLPVNPVTLTGGNASEVTFSGNNPDVATVTNDGTITVVGAGTVTITAQAPESATHSAAFGSYTLTIEKATRNAPSTLVVKHQSEVGINNGAINGVTAEMEYRLSSDDIYTPITGTVLDKLAPGTYHVRFAATPNSVASADTVVTVETFSPPAFTRKNVTYVCECCNRTIHAILSTHTEVTQTEVVITERWSDVKYDTDGSLWKSCEDAKLVARTRINIATGDTVQEVLDISTGNWIVVLD